MSTLEDLNRIKKANDILNKGFQRLGAKPIYVDPSLNEINETKANQGKFEFNFKPQIELLNQVSSKLKKEKEQKKAKIKKSSKLTNLIVGIAVITLIYTLFYMYTPEKIINQIKQYTQKITKIPESANAASSPEETIDVSPSGAKSFIISSGIFKNKSDATKKRLELSAKLGVPLKVVKVENFFTIQVGPDYQEQEDVLVVFDELSRYNIKNLSVRMQG